MTPGAYRKWHVRQKKHKSAIHAFVFTLTFFEGLKLNDSAHSAPSHRRALTMIIKGIFLFFYEKTY